MADLKDKLQVQSEPRGTTVKPRVDQNTWKQILHRPFVAPTSGLPARKESLASHCDYDFDEKDYRSHRRSIFKTHNPLRRLSRTHTHHRDPVKHDATPKAIKKKIKEQEREKGPKEKDKARENRRGSACRDYSLVEVLPEIKEHLEEHLYSAHGADGIEKAELGAYSGDKLEEDVDVHHSSAVVQPKRHHRHHHSHRHHHKKKPGKEKVTELEGDKKQSKHHHRHVHRHAHRRPRTIAEREQYLESIESRLRSGSFTLRETMQEKQVTELEEAEALDKRDLEEMTCHRFEDLRGLRRRRPQLHRPRRLKSGMKTHFTSTDFSASLQKFPVKFDHSPHEAFVELEELTKEGDVLEWKETARWIKFEEDVEVSNRWGKPHVASLSFHSLLELRQALEKGTVLLDLELYDLPSIAEAVVQNMVITDQLSLTHYTKVIAALLLKHKHQYQSRQPVLRRLSNVNDFQKLQTGSTTSLDQIPDQIHETPIDVKDAQGNDDSDADDGMIQLRIDRDNDVSVRFSPASHCIDDNTDSQVPLCSAEETSIEIERAEETAGLKSEKDKGKSKRKVSFWQQPDTSNDDAREKNESDVKSRVPEGAEATTVLVGTLDELHQPAMAFVRLAKGSLLGDLTEVAIPVRFLFILLGPTAGADTYHEIGRSIATLMSDQVFHDLAYAASGREDLLGAINQFLDDTVVLPPGEWDRELLLPILVSQSRAMSARRKEYKAAVTAAQEKEDPLDRTGNFCGGLIKDVKRKAKHYISDFKDGLNLHSLAATFFLYFAIFAPDIAFGGLLSEKTEGRLGVTEVIFASCLCGILFGLFAGQPLIIIGATGPVLVFEQSIYNFCQEFDVEFLPWRCWIGFWVMIILFCVVACEGCFLVRFFTRFTEEIFSILISTIFIYEAINFLKEVFRANPLQSGKPQEKNVTPTSDVMKKKLIHEVKGEPNTALLSAILLLGTCMIAFYMRKFRQSHFFGKRVRRIISDFGIVIAITTMLVLDLILGDVQTSKMKVPDPLQGGFAPSVANRDWFINPGGLERKMNIGWVFAAIIPAMFVGILLFMETELTGFLINKNENRLVKGAGYNLDLVLVGCLCFLCSILGLPWMCPATVRSVSHLSALSVWSTSHAPGEKPYLIEVREQRVTNIAIHMLTGISVFLAPALNRIPVAVLFGILLYLGVASLANIQLVTRAIMMLMPPKHHPDISFVRKVNTSQIYWFTIIQLVCLALLIGVKLWAAIAPSFPFFIICLIPLRKALAKFFTKEELEELDNEELDEDDSDLDEYMF